MQLKSATRWQENRKEMKVKYISTNTCKWINLCFTPTHGAER